MTPPGIELDRLRAYLDKELPGLLDGELTAALIPGGRSNLTYDLGGYSMDKSDAKKQSINRFKDDLGGTLVAESNYHSYPYHVAQALARLAAWGRDLARGRPRAAARDDSPTPVPDLGGDALSAPNR